MTTSRKDNSSVIQVDSQALIKSFKRNMSVVLVITGTFVGFVLYGFAQGSFSLLWLSLTLLFSLGLIAWASTFLLKSVFVDKSIETLLRSKGCNA